MKEFLLKVLRKPSFWIGVGSLIMIGLIFYFYSFITTGFIPDAILEITSRPERATVTYNSKYAGETPYIFKSTKTLTVIVKISLPGYNTVTINLDKTIIEPGDHKKIRIDLSLDTSLTVTSTPPGANIYIDGEQWGSTPYTFEGLISAGQHKIKVELLSQCYGEQTKDVIVDAKLFSKTHFDLEKLIMVSVSSTPTGAKVICGPDDWGVTPLVKCVKPGKYQLMLSKQGLVDEEKDIEVKEDMSVYVRMYDPESYKKKDSYAVDADQPETEIFALPKRANGELFGQMIAMGKSPAFLSKSEIQAKAGITDAPASYIVFGLKDGFSPGVTELFESGETIFPMSQLTIFSKGIQKDHKSFPSHSGHPYSNVSPNGTFSIDASKDKATLKDTASGASYELYLEKEYDYFNNTFTFSPDSSKLWYFRNNKGVRELVERDLPSQEEKVLDKVDSKEHKNVPMDFVFSCLTNIAYDSSSGKLLYFVPGASEKLTLASTKPGFGGRNIIDQDLVPGAPQVDSYKLWMVSSDVLKIQGIIPGSVLWEGLYHLSSRQPIKFKIRTDPDPSGKVGMMKQLDSGMTMFPSCALVTEKDGNLVIGVNLYNKLAALIVYSPIKRDWEFVWLRVD